MSDTVAAQDHRPECPTGNPYTDLTLCICDRLRACEERVRQDLSGPPAVNPRDGAVWKEGGPVERPYRLILDTNRGYDEGYRDAIDAATEAVLSLDRPAMDNVGTLIYADDVMAALAALKATP